MVTLNFKHSGFIGDIIFSLPAVKELCRKTGRKAHIYVFLDKTWEMLDNGNHPYKGLITREAYEKLIPLLMAMPFVESVSEWKGQTIDFDLDKPKYAGTQIGMPHSHISRWYFYLFPDSTCDLSIPTFDKMDLEGFYIEQYGVILPSIPDNSIIVNRTYRNLNPYINYVFLNQYENVYFAGTLNEYETFCNQVPDAKYLHVENFLELAIQIANCKLFIGNQSFCFSIAEQMKTPRLLEAYSGATNVIPTGANGYDFYTQQGLEMITKQIIEA